MVLVQPRAQIHQPAPLGAERAIGVPVGTVRDGLPAGGADRGSCSHGLGSLARVSAKALPLRWWAIDEPASPIGISRSSNHRARPAESSGGRDSPRLCSGTSRIGGSTPGWGSGVDIFVEDEVAWVEDKDGQARARLRGVPVRSSARASGNRGRRRGRKWSRSLATRRRSRIHRNARLPERG